LSATALINPNCACQERDCECPGTIYTRECEWCGASFELAGQPDDDDRRFCDQECARSNGGEL
jgi:hypothetical protein